MTKQSETELSLPIVGMSCASCVAHVEKALQELPGVFGTVVNLATGKASVVYDPQRVGLADFQQVVDHVGYAVATSELTLDVREMTCASCVAHVESALKELPGVQDVVVHLGLGTGHVRYIPGVVSANQMNRAVREVGYEASERSAAADSLDRERQTREGGNPAAGAQPADCRNHWHYRHDRHVLRHAWAVQGDCPDVALLQMGDWAAYHAADLWAWTPILGSGDKLTDEVEKVLQDQPPSQLEEPLHDLHNYSAFLSTLRQ